MQVAHPLRLDYMGLKKRLDGTAEPDGRSASQAAFVELVAPPATHDRSASSSLSLPAAARCASSGKRHAPPDWASLLRAWRETRRMIQITPQMRVLVAIEPVDGRKGIDALARLCQDKLAEDPFSGCVFVFRSRRGTAIRLLSYDGQGYWLAQKRLSKGQVRMVAGSRHAGQAAGSLRGAVADGGRRCVASPRGADVAAGERAEVNIEKQFFPLAFQKKRFILLLDGGTQVSGPGDQQRRHPLYKGADRRESRREPPHAVQETVRSLAMETGQRRFARHGVPRPVADAGPRRPDRVAASEVRAAQPAGAASATGAGADRHDAGGRPSRSDPAVEFAQVRRSGDEPLFNSLMEEHHYLGYEQPVGEHLKYLVWAQGRPIACLAWSSAPRHIGARDRYIGWSQEARRRNIRFLAYNTRFLILPWVRVQHLASHILGRMAARISDDWQRMYGHPIYFLETFVDPERFRGTCYRAANWTLLGRTTGRGKQSNSYVPNRSIKEVLGYPLTKRFRELLGE